VTDDERTGEGAQRGLGEHVADQPVVLDDRDLVVVEGRHARRFLSAVLQGVEGVVAEVRHVTPGDNDADDATGFLHATSTVGAFV